jgi:hypothetical protein
MIPGTAAMVVFRSPGQIPPAYLLISDFSRAFSKQKIQFGEFTRTIRDAFDGWLVPYSS